jgi:hypothetical protein
LIAQISNRAPHPQHPFGDAGTEAPLIDRGLPQIERLGADGSALAQVTGTERTVAHPVGIALEHALACRLHPLPHHGAGLAGAVAPKASAQGASLQPPHHHLQVDAIEQGA